MLTRREMIKGLATFGAFFSAGTATQAATKAASRSDVETYTNAVLEFESKARDYINIGQPLSLPFATLPMTFYTRWNTVIHEIPQPVELWPLVKQLKKYEGFDTVAAVGRELWKHWRPTGNNVKQVEELDNPKEALVKRNDTYVNSSKVIQHNRAMVDRTVSPRYTLDLHEMYPEHLATMLCSIKHVTWMLNDKLNDALKRAIDSGGYSSYELEYTPLVVEVKRDHYIIEIFSHCLAAGIVNR